MAKYTIKFHNIAEDVITFDYDGYIGSSGMDTTTFEIDFNGYQIRLPFSDLFKSFQENDRLALVNRDVIYSVSGLTGPTITTDGTSLSTSDYLWINDELFKVSSSLGSNKYRVTGAQKGTRNHLHSLSNNDPGFTAFLNGRNTPIGLECDISFKGEVVFKGFIKGLASSGAGVAVSLEPLIMKLDKEVFIKDIPLQIQNTPIQYIQRSGGFYNLLDLSEFSEMSYELNKGVDNENGFYINLLDVLNDIIKINLAFMYFEDGIYKVRSFNSYSTLNGTPASVRLNSYIEFEGSYISSFDALYSSIKLTYNVNKSEYGIYKIEERVKSAKASTLAGALSSDNNLDLSLDTLLVEDSIVENLLGKFMGSFGLMLGSLVIDTLKSSIFRVGDFYRFDQKNFNLFFNEEIIGDVIIICVNKSDYNAKFVIIRETPFHPIVPMVQGIAYEDSGHFIKFLSSTFIENVNCKQITRETLVDFKNPIDDNPYFYKGQLIEVYGLDHTILNIVEITDLVVNTGEEYFIFETDDIISSSATEIRFTYVNKISVDRDVYQAKYLYNNEGEV